MLENDQANDYDRVSELRETANVAAETLIDKVFSCLSAAQAREDRGAPVFFPNGISLLNLEIKIGPSSNTLVDISLVVSSDAKGPGVKSDTRPELLTE